MTNCPKCKKRMTFFCGNLYKCYSCKKRYRMEDGKLEKSWFEW